MTEQPAVNFDATYPGVGDRLRRSGIGAGTGFVRKSVPNTPFITAADAGLPITLRRTTRTTSVRGSASRASHRRRRTVVRGASGILPVPHWDR